MKFPPFEWIRISRKWNIHAARELWGLGRFQLKCSMGRMECWKIDVYHVANQSKLAHIMIFFFHILFDLLKVTDRVSQFPVCFRIIILNLPSFVGIHVGFSEHEPWTLTRFPAEFFPNWSFFPASFSGLRFDSILCKLSLSSAVLLYLPHVWM